MIWVVATTLLVRLTVAQDVVSDLLEREERPTLVESVKKGLLKRRLGFPSAVFSQIRQPPELWLSRVLTDAAPFVVALEEAFPDAKFAFLGRDTALIADIVEAIYEGLGRPGRVLRVPVSRGSFQNASHEDLIGLLTSIGLDLDAVEGGKRWVLIDTVSTGGGRQGRSLLEAVQLEWRELGGPPKDLVGRLGMIGLTVSTSRVFLAPIERKREFFSRDRKALRADPEAPLTVLTYHDQDWDRSSRPGFNEIGYEHHTGAWHGPFGRIEHKGRTYWTSPVEGRSILARRLVLWFQQAIARILQSKSFYKRLERAALDTAFQKLLARKSGLVLEGDSPALVKATRRREAQALNPLWNSLSRLGPSEEEPNLVSNNGETLLAWTTPLRGYLRGPLKVPLPLKKALEQGVLTREDVRLARMVLVGLQHATLVATEGGPCDSLE